MLRISPDAELIVYFEGITKSMSPAIRQIVLEDVSALLDGKRGEFLERRKDLADIFLDACQDFGVHLSFPFSSDGVKQDH